MPDRYEKYRTIVLGLIAVRLLIFLVSFFISAVRVAPAYEAFTTFLFVSSLIPLVWFIPAFYILRRSKVGFDIARILAVILIIQSTVSAISGIITAPLLGVISVSLLAIGIGIFISSFMACKSYPFEAVFPAQIHESKAKTTKIVFFIAAGIITALPGLLFGTQLSVFNIALVLSIVAFFVGGFVGLSVASQLVKKLEQGSKSLAGFYGGTGALAGSICGAVANVPMYIGGEAFLLIFAIPVGAVLGLIAGIPGCHAVCSIAKRYLVH